MSAPVARIGAHLSIAGGMHKAVARALDLHMTAVQVFTKTNRQWRAKPFTEEDIAAWRDDFAESGLTAAVSHASYLINLASPAEKTQNQSREALVTELRRAHQLGIPQVVLHPGAHMKTGPAAGTRRIAEAVRAAFGEHPELAGTRLLFELMAGQGTVLGRSTSELGTLLRELEGEATVGVCLDTCHAFAAGYDLRTPAGYEDFLSCCEQDFGLSAVGCWHLNDSRHDLGSCRDRHEHLGQGALGEEPFGYILNDRRWFDTPLLLETPKTVERVSDLRNMQVLGRLLTDPRRVPAGLMEEEVAPDEETDQ